MSDAKQEVVEKTDDSFDSKADAFFDEIEKDTQSDSSTENKPEETETTETKEPSAGDEKTELSKEKEVEVPKEFHKNPAWQRIIKERDEARRILKETQDSVPKEDIEKFNKVISSPEYIRSSMRAEGFKEEAINAKLRELGHQVEIPQENIVKSVLSKLNVNYDKLDETGRQYVDTYITDAINVAKLVAQDSIEEYFNRKVQPIQEELNQLSQTKMGETIANKMEQQIKEEGLLDFGKEVEPALLDWMNKNPKATQSDVFNYFKDINHKLTIEKLKTKKNKETRDEKKVNLRHNAEGTLSLQDLKLQKTGNFDKDADAFFDALGIN